MKTKECRLAPAAFCGLLAIAAALSARGAVEIGAGSGARLLLDESTGRVAGLVLRQRRLSCTGGFRLTDAVSGEEAAPEGVLTSGKNGDLRWTGAAPALGLRVKASFHSTPEALEIAGTLRDLRGKDRCVRLAFALECRAAGWTWWDDLRRKRVIEAGHGVYMAGVRSSVFPFCCIEDGKSSISLAIPLDRYVTHRLLYDSSREELRIEFDFGLSPATRKFPSRAAFRFFLFSADPGWGFRAAARRFYSLLPETFHTRARGGGLWMTFHDLETIPCPEDFHFGFHEAGKNPAFNRKLGVATLHYVLPGQLDVFLPFDSDRNLPLDAVERMIRSNPKYARKRDFYLRRIQVMRDCAMYKPDGSPRIVAMYANWARGRLIYDCHVNSDPDLPVGHPHAALLDAVLERTDQELAAQGLQLDGVYLDNFGGGAANYRGEHWASADHPLTFRNPRYGPCEIGGACEHEYAEHVRRKYADRKGIIFANGWTRPHLFHTSVLDAGGTETYWGTRRRRLGPVFDWDRVLAQNKVYCPLLKLDKAEFNATFSRLDDYIAECTFYGFFPSVYTSGGWKFQSFWVAPGMYERYRATFRWYLPVVQELFEAGWKPVTGAHIDDPRLGLERFGPSKPDGTFFLTVYNPLEVPVRAKVGLDDALPAVGRIAIDVLHPGTWTRLSQQRKAFEVEMQPQQCRVYRIAPLRDTVEYLLSRARNACAFRHPAQEDPAHALSVLRADLARMPPQAPATRLAEFARRLQNLADRKASYHAPGVDQRVTLRARECRRFWSAALALAWDVHLDRILPQRRELPGGTALADLIPTHARALVLDRPESDRTPGRPGECIDIGGTTLVTRGPDRAVPLYVQRRYRLSWPVKVSTSRTGDGRLTVRVDDLVGSHPTIVVVPRTGTGVRVRPERTVLHSGRDVATFAVDFEGSGAGEVGIDWLVRSREGTLLCWSTQYVRVTPPQANLLPHSGFEGIGKGSPGPRLIGSGSVVGDDPHFGSRCLRVVSENMETQHGCQWSLPIDSPPARIIVSGWSRARDVSGEPDKHYSIWVGGRTADGGWTHIGTVRFDTGTHDWQQVTRAFDVPPDVTRLNVWALFRHHTGTAWFDDVYVAPASVFAGRNLARSARVLASEPSPRPPSVIVDGVRAPDAPAWTSPETAGEHVLELQWKQAVRISRVVIYWPRGNKHPLSSTEFGVLYHDGAGWAWWALGHAYVPEKSRTLRAAPVVTDRIRLVQAPGGGPIHARRRLQVTEIEVY